MQVFSPTLCTCRSRMHDARTHARTHAQACDAFHLYKDDLLDFVHVSQRCFWDGNELRKASIKSKGSAFLVVEAALRANFGLPGCPK